MQRASEGRTVLFASHQLAVLAALCPRAIWMSHGKIMQEGPSNTVLSSYIQTLRDKGAEKVEFRGGSW